MWERMRKKSNLCLLLLHSTGSLMAASSLSLTKCIALNLHFSVTVFPSVSWPVQTVLAWRAHRAIEQLLGCLCQCWLTGSPYATFLLPLVHALAGAGYSYTAGIFVFATRTPTLRVNSDWLLAFDPSGKWWEGSFRLTCLTSLWLCLGKFKIAISICSWKFEQLEDGPFVIIFY